MIEIKRKSVIPVYGVAAVWVLYCAFFPLYRTWHFVIMACLAVLVFFALSLFFPGKVERIEIPEKPERTGDEEIDALLAEGETAVAEMRSLCDRVQDMPAQQKLDAIISVTDKIFKNLIQYPGNVKQVRRFADYYLPTTIKLLHAYDRFGQKGAWGDNITGTLDKIESALGTILDSYGKFFDSLFEAQALDIATDIIVLENMLKRENLLSSDFGVQGSQ